MADENNDVTNCFSGSEASLHLSEVEETVRSSGLNDRAITLHVRDATKLQNTHITQTHYKCTMTNDVPECNNRGKKYQSRFRSRNASLMGEAIGSNQSVPLGVKGATDVSMNHADDGVRAHSASAPDSCADTRKTATTTRRPAIVVNVRRWRWFWAFELCHTAQCWPTSH